MKMFKLMGKRGFAVFTSLALCASLVAPSFAATIADLKNVIDTGSSLFHENGDFRIEYNEGTVKLYEDVAAAGSGNLHLENDSYNVTLDLNGHTVQGNTSSNANDATIVLKNGAELTVTDTSEDKDGQIVSGTWGGVSVESGSTFTMEGGKVTNNKAYTNGAQNNHSASGVTVKDGTFIMNGGEISGNNGNKPTVIVKGDEGKGEFEMNGGTIDSGDKTTVSVESGSFSMNDGTLRADEGVNVLDVADGANAEFKAGNVSSKDVVEDHLHEDSTIGDVKVNGFYQVTYTEPQPGPTVPPTLPEPSVVEDPQVEIDEPAVPLAAGPVTQGEFVDYLWRHEGEPEAEPIVADDHEYAPAISWAQSAGIIDAETFDADDLVTVAMVRDILTRFALYADMAMPELTTLADDDDEAVLNCDEILAEFFGE